jgi:hypothetical protein
MEGSAEAQSTQTTCDLAISQISNLNSVKDHIWSFMKET